MCVYVGYFLFYNNEWAWRIWKITLTSRHSSSHVGFFICCCFFFAVHFRHLLLQVLFKSVPRTLFKFHLVNLFPPFCLCCCKYDFVRTHFARAHITGRLTSMRLESRTLCFTFKQIITFSWCCLLHFFSFLVRCFVILN